MPIGFKSPPTSDPVEAELRAAWYETQGTPEHAAAHSKLAKYLWDRVQADIAEDRRRHPKARRNQGKPSNLPENPNGRTMP